MRPCGGRVTVADLYARDKGGNESEHVGSINEAATELLKTKLQKSQRKALQNQINKGETARSILALIIVVIDVIVTNMIS